LRFADNYRLGVRERKRTTTAIKATSTIKKTTPSSKKPAGKKSGTPLARRSNKKNSSILKEKSSLGKSTKAPFKFKSIVGSEDNSATNTPSNYTKGKGK